MFLIRLQETTFQWKLNPCPPNYLHVWVCVPTSSSYLELLPFSGRDALFSQRLWTQVFNPVELPTKFLSVLTDGLPWGSDGKESACNAGDPGSILGLERSPAGAHGNPLQYSCLENSMDRGGWRPVVHGVTKSQTRLGDWHTQTPIDMTYILIGKLYESVRNQRVIKSKLIFWSAETRKE